MSLHFHSPHAPRWLRLWLHPDHPHAGRATTVVLTIIGVSLFFSVLQVIDIAVSGVRALQLPPHVSAVSPSSATPSGLAASGIVDPAATLDTSFEVPSATAEAISL